MKTKAPEHTRSDRVLLAKRWRERWLEALGLWGSFVRLPEPIFCQDTAQARAEGLTESFAMIRLTDHRIVLSPMTILSLGIGEYALEIMGHEIGHHVYCPADMSDTGRMIARIRRALPTMEQYAPMVGNLYTDLLINDRLFRQHGLRMDAIYRAMKAPHADALWTFYLRIYEILWGLQKGTLVEGETSTELEADARLGNRVVRSYANDWVRGAGRFAALCLTYLLAEKAGTSEALRAILDAQVTARGDEIPDGLAEMDDGEEGDSIHPALEDDEAEEKRPTQPGGPQSVRGNYREPFEYGQILRAMGITVSDEDIAVRYYRERARPHLVPFPVRVEPRASDPMPEGLDQWDIGEPIDGINWIETAMRAPVVVPGVTTVQTRYGEERGFEKAVTPIDLDLYVDCSGSMPDPRQATSYLALAGTIIALSALRAGSRVQATLWSDTGGFQTTNGFVSDERLIMTVITGYIGGGTAFPIHILRDTYANRKPTDRTVHILCISDDGITTMYDNDERGNSGRPIAANALARAAGGGSLVLNLYGDWRNNKELLFASEQGWAIYPVSTWEDLVAFSREFVRRNYLAHKTSRGVMQP
ncbi:MAG TPA: VWA domain-containing protein [Spirochaetota bacterium]|nr:VWA domain-containing protein [Spirochaetota bacterium]